MPAYIQGNLAVDKKLTPKVTIKETKKVVYRNKSLPAQEKMLYLFTVVLCVIVAGVIIWRYAQIYQMNAEMLKIQQDIRQIQAENSALKQEVEMLQSPERLGDKAKEFGFVPQDNNQVSQETVGKPNTSKATANKPTPGNANTKSSGGSNKVAFNP
jgi:cell division protein FtsL